MAELLPPVQRTLTQGRPVGLESMFGLGDGSSHEPGVRIAGDNALDKLLDD